MKSDMITSRTPFDEKETLLVEKLLLKEVDNIEKRISEIKDDFQAKLSEALKSPLEDKERIEGLLAKIVQADRPQEGHKTGDSGNNSEGIKGLQYAKKDQTWESYIASLIDLRDDWIYPTDIVSQLGLSGTAADNIRHYVKRARKSGVIVGYPLYMAHSRTGGLVETYINGLPRFFVNVQEKSLLPEYEDKLRRRAEELDLKLTK